MKVPAVPPVGSLIAYEYLWASQAGERDDGVKTYPTAVLMATEISDGVVVAYALGISHRPPRKQERALQLPMKLQKWLGLDDDPCWIYTDQMNVFTWPGPDLRPADRLSTRLDALDTCVIAPLPADWFETVKAHLIESRRLKRLAVHKRTT